MVRKLSQVLLLITAVLVTCCCTVTPAPAQRIRERFDDGPANPNVAELIEKLRSPNPVTRLQAAKSLGLLGPAAREALPALTQALQDPDVDVRIVAGNALRRIQGAADNPPTGQSNAADQTIPGRLGEDDPTDGIRKGSHAKSHTVNLKVGEGYVIDLESADFDSYLYLFDAAGNLLASNDDAGGNRNARIQFFPLRTEAYKIVATSFGPGQTGTYRLIIKPYVPAAAPVDSAGQLDANSQKTKDGKPFALHKIKMVAGLDYLIDVISTEFDPVVALLDSTGKVLASDDDSGGSLNARLFYRATKNDTYDVMVYSYRANGIGKFRVVVRSFSPPRGPGTPGKPPPVFASTARIVMTRLLLAHGRLDSIRLPGLFTTDNPKGRAVPGVDPLVKLIAAQADPLRLTLDLNEDGTLPRDPMNPSPIVLAAAPLSSGFSLVVTELGPGDSMSRWEFLRTRFGDGNLYATVSIPSAGIRAGMELVTKEQLEAYPANSIFYEAPDFGDIVINHDLEGGTSNISSTVINNGKPRTIFGKVAWANPMDLVLSLESQKRIKKIEDNPGEVQLYILAQLPMGFETAFTIRWAAETNKETIIRDAAVVSVRPDNQKLARFARFQVRLPADTEGSVKISAVASPGPFLNPLPPAPQSIGLNTFHSGGATLEDTLGVLVKKEDIDDTITKKLDDAKAKSGDVQISLYWNSKDDLDLHVVGPSGQTIYYGNRKSKDGGELDVDMNVSYDKAVAGAVENIFWPKGKAPPGKYKVYVNHYSHHGGKAGCADPAPFHVRVLIQGQAQIFNNTVTTKDGSRRRVLVHEFELK